MHLYEATDCKVWNVFIDKAKNATFLFNRDFMDYHKDRFDDFSLMVFENEKLLAVLPANKVGNEVFSHQGLTYGGLIVQNSIGFAVVEIIFLQILDFLNNNSIATLHVKPVVSIYQKNASFEINYLLSLKGAELYRRDMNLAIDFSKTVKISKSKLKHYKREIGLGLSIKKENEFENFWNKVLIPRLKEKHQASPVHTLYEIQYLNSRFPDSIYQYNVYFDDEIIAGITIFNFGNVVKSQYGATTILGEKYRALDYLFINLIAHYKEKVAYFDMGTVNENAGKKINYGLLKQKEELGCSIYTLDFYKVNTNY